MSKPKVQVKVGDAVIVDGVWQGYVDCICVDTDGTRYATVIDQEGDAYDIDIEDIEAAE